jgi:hypothetical protein
MPIIEGTRSPKTWRGSYSFAVDGGAIGTITLRSDDSAIPSGSVVTGGYLDVTTLFTTGTAATGALQVQTANDLQTATVVSGAPFSTTGVKDLVPDETGSTAIKLTANRSPAFLIASGTVTAGAFTLVLNYV